MVYAMRTGDIVTTKKDIFAKKSLSEDVRKRRAYLSSIEISILDDLDADVVVTKKRDSMRSGRRWNNG